MRVLVFEGRHESLADGYRDLTAIDEILATQKTDSILTTFWPKDIRPTEEADIVEKNW